MEQCAHVLRTQGSRGSDDTDEAAFQGQQNGDTAAERGKAGPAARGCYTTIQGKEEGDISLDVDMDEEDKEVLIRRSPSLQRSRGRLTAAHCRLTGTGSPQLSSPWLLTWV